MSVPLQVESRDMNLLGSRDGGVDSRQAQTAFFTASLAFRGAEHGVNKHLFLAGVRIAFRVNYEQLKRQVNLVRGQTNSPSFVHELKHLFDRIPNKLVDLLEGLRAMSQCQVWVVNDFQKSVSRLWIPHNSSLSQTASM